jgi:2-dehydropantoate 2-reductase
MNLWLRCHVPLCIAFESISVAGVRRGAGASWNEAMLVARGLRECFVLIRRLGYRVYPSGKARLAASPVSVVAAMLWCLSRVRSFRELLATGIDECNALVDNLVALATLAEPLVSVRKIRAMKQL